MDLVAVKVPLLVNVCSQMLPVRRVPVPQIGVFALAGAAPKNRLEIPATPTADAMAIDFLATELLAAECMKLLPVGTDCVEYARSGKNEVSPIAGDLRRSDTSDFERYDGHVRIGSSS